MINKFLTKILCFIFIISAVGCASDLNLRLGINSFRNEDYRQAFIRLKPAAQKGQPDAQYAIGYMYYYGQGVEEDRKKAWFWINQAAAAGQADAIVAVKMLKQRANIVIRKQKQAGYY